MVIYYSRLNEENYNKIVCKAKQNKCLIIFFQLLIAKKKKNCVCLFPLLQNKVIVFERAKGAFLLFVEYQDQLLSSYSIIYNVHLLFF